MPEKRSSDASERNDRHTAHKKQRRSLDHAKAEIFTRKAAAETALEIDIMILDYQAYRTTICMLETTYDSPEDVQSNLQCHLDICDSWWTMFTHRHPQYRGDAELQIRLALLRFCTLYFQRLVYCKQTPDPDSLEELRGDNTDRVLAWVDQPERMPSLNFDDTLIEAIEQEELMPWSQVVEHRQRNMTALGVPEALQQLNKRFYGNSNSVSLLDILPAFMHIFALIRAQHNGTLDSSVLNLFIAFMRQAYLEQYTVCGTHGLDAIDQAFAWGCYGKHPETTEAWHDDSMFRDDETGEERDLWTHAKQSLVNELMVDDGQSVRSKLIRLDSEHPLQELDRSIRSCLKDLVEVIELPILLQLEQGTLNGLSREQTSAFLTECGFRGGLSM